MDLRWLHEVCSQQKQNVSESSYNTSSTAISSLAEELEDYLDNFPEIGKIQKLEWGHVMAVGNSTFLFMSNSWSDSGLFLDA